MAASSGKTMLSRQLCVSAVLHRKNLAAAGPEKFSDEFIKKQVEEFNIGKRHLANMMGEDPETFTQGDIDRSITYLFPSGLFDNKAKPLMKDTFTKALAVEKHQDRLRGKGLFIQDAKQIEQLMFSLHFMGVLGRFDMQCSVSGGGHSSQAGALRLAISCAMLSFLSEGQVETMRQAGLLTPDPRIKERKKPGQEGARRKYTWKKR
ncbi:28S ribosomal protein S9, mitochondrial-like [Salmo trutta]|uniref:28S ribosomal protein S9, mitochondrial-like n=1 Tax=Salmo trutta TaxID=8032 RepID=UPI001130D717|nr:28S ribosomal protein S9, mitochondrial-like [Salmo trutta]